jgi:sensor histidine kinase YesM
MARRDRARAALREAELERQRRATEAVEARLSALQAQIEPHFLFNTLANVRRLYDTDATRGAQMLGGLVDYLRSALPTLRGHTSTLGREIELARALLTVLQLRMGERMAFRIDADDALADLPLPPMVLPTLVENAVKHGLAPLPEGGRIDIRVRKAVDEVLIEVADSGCGFTGSAGHGVGLANTRARLAALYGPAGRLSLRANAPRGVIAEIRVPRDPAARTAAASLAAQPA